MESMVNFSFRSKTVFHFLPAVDPETLPISKVEPFKTIGNDFQPLTTVVKISARFLNPHMATKDLALLTFLTSFRLLFQRIGSILD